MRDVLDGEFLCAHVFLADVAGVGIFHDGDEVDAAPLELVEEGADFELLVDEVAELLGGYGREWVTGSVLWMREM